MGWMWANKLKLNPEKTGMLSVLSSHIQEMASPGEGFILWEGAGLQLRGASWIQHCHWKVRSLQWLTHYSCYIRQNNHLVVCQDPRGLVVYGRKCLGSTDLDVEISWILS